MTLRPDNDEDAQTMIESARRCSRRVVIDAGLRRH
jgi:hypothetical protein